MFKPCLNYVRALIKQLHILSLLRLKMSDISNHGSQPLNGSISEMKNITSSLKGGGQNSLTRHIAISVLQNSNFLQGLHEKCEGNYPHCYLIQAQGYVCLKQSLYNTALYVCQCNFYTSFSCVLAVNNQLVSYLCTSQLYYTSMMCVSV